ASSSALKWKRTTRIKEELESNPQFFFMDKEKIYQQQQRVQHRLVAWIVLTICFQIITALTGWLLVKAIAWLATAYCVLLIILWCYLELWLLRKHD
ncbi:hypothetical protein, partial [Limosilactobacillus oris]|uniref:hypothetical protein n=2 Tax=Limosilactobacillus oris TaxID=1632 RepID=UPI0026590B91